MTHDDDTGRRPSSPVDPTRTQAPASSQASSLFRAQALRQLDVATEIDNQLPLVPRRTWLIVLGLALLAVSGVTWAALTPSQTSVSSTGRVVAVGGISQISTMVAGTVASTTPSTGDTVEAGKTIFEIMDMQGTVPVTSMASGKIWQVLTQMGAGVESGAVLATVLPDGSDRSVLLVVSEGAAQGIGPGQQVIVNGTPNGRVENVGAPLPSVEVEPKVGIPLASNELYVVVTVALQNPLAAGSEVQGRIILTEQSVLSQLLGVN